MRSFQSNGAHAIFLAAMEEGAAGVLLAAEPLEGTQPGGAEVVAELGV
jgi:hypothetical protein